MADDSFTRRRLAQAYAEFRVTVIPTLAGGLDLQGADIDLKEEDSYLAGLTDTFLKGGDINVVAISLDESIDRRLDSSRASDQRAIRALEAFRAYREKMHNLGQLLSRCSRIPIGGQCRPVSAKDDEERSP